MLRSFHQPRIRSSRAGKLCPVSTGRYCAAIGPPRSAAPPGPPPNDGMSYKNKIRPATRLAFRNDAGAHERVGTGRTPAVPPYLAAGIAARRSLVALSPDAPASPAARHAAASPGAASRPPSMTGRTRPGLLGGTARGPSGALRGKRALLHRSAGGSRMIFGHRFPPGSHHPRLAQSEERRLLVPVIASAA